VIAAPETPLISKPHMFPDTPADSAVKPAVPSTPAATAAASSGSESKPTKAREKPNIPTPAAASTATNKPKETTDKPEEPKREAAAPARKPSPSGKPQGAPAARKSEPPAQVAAVTPKSEPGSGPEAALARLTQEIQRTSSQVLSQPAGASQTNDVTTQVEVRFAAGGWVRSIVVGESSGSQDLDEQALALARATRFPDVPEELRSRDFSVRYPVTFRAAR
jgi:TonB family protein